MAYITYNTAACGLPDICYIPSGYIRQMPCGRVITTTYIYIFLFYYIKLKSRLSVCLSVHRAGNLVVASWIDVGFALNDSMSSGMC